MSRYELFDRSRIELGDLAADDVNHLLADTLQLAVADCRDLGWVLVEKTAGNPFYFRQLLYALESEEELAGIVGHEIAHVVDVQVTGKHLVQLGEVGTQ